MKFITELKDNDHVLGHYLCKFKQSLKTRTGKTYYSLKLQDKTGAVDAKVWELTNDIQDFNEGDMVKIDATALSYQNEIQLKVHKLRRSQEGEYVLSDYIPTTEKNVDEMYAQLVAMVESVENTYIRTLLENILIKDKDRAAALKSHSAAKAMHHGYMGGLLEHILSVAQICDFMSGRYKYINRDLLLAGAFLHDIGKIYELSPMPQNEYTDDGQMLGHIIIGVEMVVVETLKIPDFPHDIASLIKHLIISHHGEYEFGSPKLPSTSEAILLHYADNMDAKLKTIEEVLDKDTTPGLWTGYNKALARYLRKVEL
ncbi:MAG: HD domain-containing protein [Defluviitaleaceae bacterium]|nr:HD domain-containing protein [Defluviitaleaceae bacterium]